MTAHEPRKRILVIEDDEAMAKAVKVRLESAGYTVHTEGCAAVALSYAAEHRPNLIILDLRLPDLGGYEVCRRLRQMFDPWIPPILMLTGMDQPVDQLRGFAHGADAYLTKPCDSAELTKTVAVLLGERTPV